VRCREVLATARSRRPFRKGASVSIIGAGKSGIALAMAGERLDYIPFVSDSGLVSESAATELRSRGIPFEESGHTERILESDVVVLSSGISPRSKAVKIAISAGKPLMGELDFLGPFVKSRVLAVTGSNGKTTTVTLAGHILERSGVKSAVAGNVGKPLADHLPGDTDVLVVELSSFQLFWAHSFPVDSAVITNIAPDHLDWHGSMEEYVLAKRKLIDLVAPGGSLVFQQRDREILEPFPADARLTTLRWGEYAVTEQNEIVLTEDRAIISGGGAAEDLFAFSDSPLLGNHNRENVAMALAALRSLGFIFSNPRSYLETFQAPAHRCQFAGKCNGVIFVDDSKGTNVAASVAALESLEGEKIIILGGQGKGEDYLELALAVKRKARGAVLLGAEKDKIGQALIEQGFSSFEKTRTMEEAVRAACRMARPNDMVLLSPACTSWDMYPNYGERGFHFQRIVRSMIERSDE